MDLQKEAKSGVPERVSNVSNVINFSETIHSILSKLGVVIKQHLSRRPITFQESMSKIKVKVKINVKNTFLAITSFKIDAETSSQLQNVANRNLHPMDYVRMERVMITFALYDVIC